MMRRCHFGGVERTNLGALASDLTSTAVKPNFIIRDLLLLLKTRTDPN